MGGATQAEATRQRDIISEGSRSGWLSMST